MKFRNLRIAWSVFFGVACVLLIVLWVRSYWWHDGIAVRTSGTSFISAMSGNGSLVLSRADGGLDGAWTSGSHRIDPKDHNSLDNDKKPLYSGLGFHTARFSNGAGIVMPHWFFVAAVAILGTVPWLSCRFSLRALLIATTFLALLLGLVYATRSK